MTISVGYGERMKNVIIGIGEILWDVLPSKKVLGGAPANFAYHASQFGFDGYAVSAIGKDALGKEIIDELAKRKLHYHIETTDFPTGTVQVTLDGNGVPHYEICQDVAWDNIPFTPKTEELAKNACAVCFGSLAQRNKLSRETIQRFLDAVPSEALRIFDINLRQHFYSKDIIEQSLSKSNVFKINDDELHVILPLLGLETMNETQAGKVLMKKYNLRYLIITKGAIGSYVFDNNDCSYLNTPKVQVADTVGAGDSFTGAFAASLLKGKSLKEAHELAVQVSAFVCTQHGAMPILPDSFVNLLRN